FVDAFNTYQQALAIVKSSVAAPRDVALAYVRLGAILADLGKFDEALHMSLEASEILERLVANDPSESFLQLQLANIHRQIGDVHEKQENLDGAVAGYQISLQILDRLNNFDPNNVSWAMPLSKAYVRLGDTYKRLRNFNGARDQYKSALLLLQKLAAKR